MQIYYVRLMMMMIIERPDLRCVCILAIHLTCKSKKSKAVPLHAMEALVGKEIYSYSLLTSALDGVSGQHHASAVL
jgi:hypothetical protein